MSILRDPNGPDGCSFTPEPDYNIKRVDDRGRGSWAVFDNRTGDILSYHRNELVAERAAARANRGEK